MANRRGVLVIYNSGKTFFNEDMYYTDTGSKLELRMIGTPKSDPPVSTLDLSKIKEYKWQKNYTGRDSKNQ